MGTSSFFHALLVLSLYLEHSGGVTIGNRISTSQLSTLRVEPSVESVQHLTEPSPIFHDDNGNIGETDNIVDTNVDVTRQSGQNANVAEVLRKRSIGKIFLNLVPSIINDFGGKIKDLFGLSRRQVESQGLTQEQLDVLLLAIAESRCSGAGTSLETNASVWMILSLVTLRHFLGI